MVAEHHRHQGQGCRRQHGRQRRAAPGQDVAERQADESAQHGHDHRLPRPGQQSAAPRVRVPGGEPGRFRRQPDGPDDEPAGESQLPGPGPTGQEPERRLDRERLAEVEREARQRVPEAEADQEQGGAPQQDEERDRAQPR